MKTTWHSPKAMWLFCLCTALEFTTLAQQAGPTNPLVPSSGNGNLATNAPGVTSPAVNGGTNAAAGTGGLTVTVATDPGEMVLKYEEFLQAETKTHREFIESMNKEVAVAIAIIIAVAGFFGFRSWKDLKAHAYTTGEKMAEQGMQSAIGSALEKRTMWLEKTQKASREKVFREFKSLFSKQILNHYLTLPTVKDGEALKGRKVLWVDDDPVGIACQVAIFEALKMPVSVVQTTTEALEKLGEDAYSLMISNMNRDPEPIAGILLAQAVRKNSKIPILIFTKQQHIDNYGEKAKDAGVDALESNPERIVSKIEELLASRNKTNLLT